MPQSPLGLSFEPNQSVVRAVAILQAVADVPEGLTLSALARAASLPPATAFRLVQTLEHLRLLAKVPDTRRIVLGMTVARLAAGYVPGRELLAASRPHVEALAQQVHEAVEVAAVVDDQAPDVTGAIDVLFRVESTHVLQAAHSARPRIPLHVTSIGRVLLAHRDGRELEEVLARPLPRLATGTVTDPERLRQEVEEVRRGGVAVGADEIEDGAAGLAAGVHDLEGRLAGILHVEVPSARLDLGRRAEISRLVRSTVAAIEADLQELLRSRAAGRG